MKVSYIHVDKDSVIEVDVMSIEENYLTVDIVGAECSWYLVHGFKTPVSIHTTGLRVMEYTV